MVKYCVANECPINTLACEMLPSTVISSASNTYEEAKAPWDWTAEYVARHGQLHILEYLVERKYDQFVACGGRPRTAT